MACFDTKKARFWAYYSRIGCLRGVGGFGIWVHEKRRIVRASHRFKNLYHMFYDRAGTEVESEEKCSRCPEIVSNCVLQFRFSFGELCGACQLYVSTCAHCARVHNCACVHVDHASCACAYVHMSTIAPRYLPDRSRKQRCVP